jgi:hypothetical protein
MKSKNSKPFTPAESEHIERVKSQPCSVCKAHAPSEAHHIKQGQHWTTVALCRDCHRGGNGWHGDKTMWRIHKMDEIDALAVTIQWMFL